METVRRSPPEPFIMKQEKRGKAKGHRRKGETRWRWGVEKEQKEGDSAHGEGARWRNERESRGVGGRKR